MTHLFLSEGTSGSTRFGPCAIMSVSSRSASSLRAEVAELADAQASGACGRKVVEVQILSSAPAIAPVRTRIAALLQFAGRMVDVSESTTCLRNRIRHVLMRSSGRKALQIGHSQP